MGFDDSLLFGIGRAPFLPVWQSSTVNVLVEKLRTGRRFDRHARNLVPLVSRRQVVRAPKQELAETILEAHKALIKCGS